MANSDKVPSMANSEEALAKITPEEVPVLPNEDLVYYMPSADEMVPLKNPIRIQRIKRRTPEEMEERDRRIAQLLANAPAVANSDKDLPYYMPSEDEMIPLKDPLPVQPIKRRTPEEMEERARRMAQILADVAKRHFEDS